MTTPSKTIDFDDSLGKCLRCLLRKVVPYATVYGSVGVLASEFFGIRTRVGVWRAIGITFKRDCRYGDDRSFRKPVFQVVIFRLTFGQANSPTVIVNHDGDMIRVFEGRCAP